MDTNDIRWNEQARQKILDDADAVLREAVTTVAGSDDASDSDRAYAALVAHLKDRFIDWEPGPDVRKYADAISSGEITS